MISFERVSIGRLAKGNLHQLRADVRWSLKDLPKSDGWYERISRENKGASCCQYDLMMLCQKPPIKKYHIEIDLCDGKLTKIPNGDFIFARVKTGQVGTWSPTEISPVQSSFLRQIRTGILREGII